jgi:Tfp pilus assembly protein PilN
MPLRLRKSEQPPALLIPAWHPNFRNHERLPDTKVVRTQFFVNFVAIAIAASLVLYFVFQEYRIKNLARQVAEWQSQIDTNQKSSAQAVALSRKFGEEQKKIDELAQFLSQRLVLSQFLEHLGATLPKTIALDAVDVRDGGVEIRGTVAGTPDEAAGRTSAYLEQLRQDKYEKGIFGDIALNRLEPQATAGHLSFDLFLHYKKGAARK